MADALGTEIGVALLPATSRDEESTKAMGLATSSAPKTAPNAYRASSAETAIEEPDIRHVKAPKEAADGHTSSR